MSFITQIQGEITSRFPEKLVQTQGGEKRVKKYIIRQTNKYQKEVYVTVWDSCIEKMDSIEGVNIFDIEVHSKKGRENYYTDVKVWDVNRDITKNGNS